MSEVNIQIDSQSLEKLQKNEAVSFDINCCEVFESVWIVPENATVPIDSTTRLAISITKKHIERLVSGLSLVTSPPSKDINKLELCTDPQ